MTNLVVVRGGGATGRKFLQIYSAENAPVKQAMVHAMCMILFRRVQSEGHSHSKK